MSIVFLAFAPSAAEHLPALQQEDRALGEILVLDSILNGYTLIREQHATPELINSVFGKHGKEIAIFHYSGHASSNALLIDDRLINAQGIAHQLKASAANGNLKLVVLNGCSTKAQVSLLLELGVPAVIATHAPVNDLSACNFSIRLFEKLSGGLDLEAAFQSSLEAAASAGNQAIDLKNNVPRSIQYLESIPDDQSPLWELFRRNPTDINFNPLPKSRYQASVNDPPNDRLRDTLYTALDLQNNTQLQANTFADSQDIEDLIVRMLPMPIGEHLAKLFLCEREPLLHENVHLRKIKHICTLYYVTMEFLSYVMIAQLWEYRSLEVRPTDAAKGNHHLPDTLLQTLTEYFHLSLTKRTEFHYRDFFRSIAAFFQNRTNLDFFIEELKDLNQFFREDSPFSNACEFLAYLSSRNNKGTVSVDEAEELAGRAEGWIADIFSKLGFLQRYHLVSIQAISIFKYRHIAKPTFNHSVIRLMRVNSSEKVLYKLEDCIDCQGVVLLKGNLVRNAGGDFQADGELKFLNLSPFLIDISAFAGGGSIVRIGIFGEYVPSETGFKDDFYRYKDIQKPDDTRVLTEVKANSQYMSVKEEMDYFRKEILGTSITIT